VQIDEFVEQLTKNLPPEKLQYVAAALQRREPIAVVGMACRLPGKVSSPLEFWSKVRDGYDAVTTVPDDRWSWREYFDPERGVAGKSYSRWGAFVDDVFGFEPGFFDISPLDGTYLDPQQRLLLEVGWEAIEDAGLSREDLRGSATGVFFGVFSDDYFDLQHAGTYWAHASAATGTQRSMAAGRMAHWLDVHGPAVVLDTSCSSSLVATHQACQSLRAMETDAAIVGGVQLYLSPREHIMTSRLGMCSPDGACRLLDAKANGFVHGEGCGVVILKRLSSAISAGDRVYALIRGSAVNHDGQTLGLTAPNGAAQQAVIRSALRASGVDPASVNYIEMHGTGTALGDPCEMEAIQATYGGGTSTCFLGSAKTNIGHTAAAAGVCGLIRAIESMRHGEIAPNPHLKQLNPRVRLEGTRFRCPQERVGWERNGSPRRSAVSAFGASGTNAHVILEEGEAAAAPVEECSAALIALSGRSPQGLLAALKECAQWLATSDENAMDVAYTSCCRRTHWEQRVAFVARDLAGLRALVAARVAEGGMRPRPAGTLAFHFSHSVVDIERASALLLADPGLRPHVERMAAALDDLVPWSLMDVLAHGEAVCGGQGIPIASLALQLALAARLVDARVAPSAACGDGLGVLAAAVLAERLTPVVALRIALSCDTRAPKLPKYDELPAPSGADSGSRVLLFCNGAKRPSDESWSAAQWRDAVHNPAQTSSSFELLRASGVGLVIQPHGGNPASPTWSDDLECVALLDTKDDPALALSRAFAAAFERGASPQWHSLPWVRGRLISLFRQPWQKTLLAAPRRPSARAVAEISHGMVRQASEIEAFTCFQSRISLARYPYLAEHRVLGRPTLPAAFHVELMQAVAGQVLPEAGLEDVRFVEPVVLESGVELELRCTHRDGSLAVETLVGLEWTTCATARAIAPRAPEQSLESTSMGTLPNRLSNDEFYAMWDSSDGVAYGHAFRGIRELRFGDSVARARVELPDDVELSAGMLQHPALLDACLQVTAGAVLSETGGLAAELILPKGIAAFNWRGPPLRSVEVLAVLRSGQPENEIVADLRIYDDNGKQVATCDGFASVRGGQRSAAAQLEYRVEWTRLASDGPPVSSRPGFVFGSGPWCSTIARGLEVVSQTLTQSLAEQGLPRRGARLVTTLEEQLGLSSAAERGKRLCLQMSRFLRELLECVDDCEFILVTRSSQAVSGQEREIDPAQAALWGIVTTFQAEHARITCRLVDVDDSVPTEALLEELQRSSDDTRVALRGEGRFGRRLLRGATEPTTSQPVGKLERGYYLITGGLGHVGQAIASHFTEQGDYVVLLSRRKSSADRPGASSSRQLRNTKHVTGDVTEARALRQLFDRCDAEYGTLKGVVHCAAVLKDAAFERMSETEFSAAWQPKAEGAVALEHALEGRAPGFVLFCSSMNAVLPSEGQANTAAANCFLDALAERMAKRGVPVTSVNWGAWRESPALDAALTQRLLGMGVGTFSDQDACGALDRLLKRGTARACVMRFRPEKWVETHDQGERALCEALLEVASAPNELKAHLAALTVEKRQEMVFDGVADELVTLLRVERARLDKETSLESLGLTSLSALELRGSLRRKFGVSLPATVVWRHPTLGALVATIVDAVTPAAEHQPESHTVRRLPTSSEATSAGRESVPNAVSEEEIERLLELEINAGV